MTTPNSFYDYDGLSTIVVSHVVTDNNIELYVGHRDFCELCAADIMSDSSRITIEPVTRYAIRKYDGISSKATTLGYGTKSACVAWIKRNCDNAGDDIAVNCNYHIDGYVNGNGGFYKFRIEHVEEEDY